MSSYVDLDTVRLAVNDDGSWYAPNPTQKPKIHITWVERPSGRKRYLSTRTSDRSVAQQRLSEFIAAQHRSEAEKVEATIDEIFAGYLADRELKGSATDYFLRPFIAKFGRRLFSTITKPELIAYRAERKAAKGRAKGSVVDPATVYQNMRTVETLRNWAIANKYVPKRLADDLVPIEFGAQVVPKKVRALMEAETDELWARLTARVDGDGRSSRIARWAALAIDTGARKWAIERLTWSQVHLDTGYVDFALPASPLNGKRHANVPMSPRLRQFLTKARAQAKSDLVLDHDGDTEPAWDRALKGTAFEGVNQHLLRHSFATQQLLRGANPVMVAKALGDDLKTMMERYAHLLPDHINLRWGEAAASPQLTVVAA